ncbi:hypothetical protein FRX31_033893 [Thalictrum thalictroides]|uniref:DUF4283 domain-containing protein n=1 Tax=Thalictrum thalictroides TaxID=46969 RepID=A0A7J6UWF3_THATH|nr:hypothetical protein FRX31_033893 [Thalictrum thalictroides]
MGVRQFANIENKSFEVVFWISRGGAEAVDITERSGVRVFRSSTSAEGSKWMGKFLCECSVDLIKSERYQDQWVSILGAVRQNNNGPYVEFALYKKNESKKYRILCFPAGENNEGWVDGGLMLLALFNPGIRMAGIQSLNPKAAVPNSSSHVDEREWPEVGRTNRTDKLQNRGEKSSPNWLNLQRFVVESKRGMLNFSWWKSAVICKPTVRLSNWRPALAKIIEEFGEASISELETGEAIVFLQSQELAFQLTSMKPLVVDEAEIAFKRWTPEFNSIELSALNPEFVWIHLTGVPIHLKKKEVVEAIVNKYCSHAEADQVSLGIAHRKAKVKAWKPRWNLIPRMVEIEERGFKFPVIIDVETAHPLIEYVPEKEVAADQYGKKEGEYTINYVADAYSDDGSNFGGHYQPVVKERQGVADNNNQGWTEQHVTTLVSPNTLSLPLQNQIETNTAGRVDREFSNFEFFTDVTRRKGKAVAVGPSNPLGKASFFSPLELDPEDDLSKMGQNRGMSFPCSRNGAHNNGHNKEKPRKASSWNSNPSLVLSRKYWASSFQKKKKEKNDRLVHNVLQSLDRFEAQQKQVVAKPISILHPDHGPEPSLRFGSHEASIHLDHGPDSLASNPKGSNEKSSSQEVDMVPSSMVSSESVDVTKLTAIKAMLKDQEGVNMNEDSLARVIENLLEPVAEHLGVTSNLGASFVKFVMKETASQKLKEKLIENLDEDDREILNYANSNLAIGNVCVDHVV